MNHDTALPLPHWGLNDITMKDALSDYSCSKMTLVSSLPDKSYSSYYMDSDYPLVKALRDPIYVEVRILQRTDPDLVLVLHHCWATPSINPHQQMQWPVLVDG